MYRILENSEKNINLLEKTLNIENIRKSGKIVEIIRNYSKKYAENIRNIYKK